MRQSHQGCPGLFRGVFIAVMAAVCIMLAVFAVEQHGLRFQIEDLTLKLDTSRQREAKQTYEYNLVLEELPGEKARLEELAPIAEELEAQEKALRQERKELRASLAALEEELQTRQAEYDALLAQAEELQQTLSSLQEMLQAPMNADP